MSDTMNASGVQVLEPKSGMSGRASAAGSPEGTYEVQNHSGVEWYQVTIAQQEPSLWTLRAEGYIPFVGTATLDPAPFLHVKFASDANPEEVVYASLIDNELGNMLTLTYVHTPAATLSKKEEPGTQTGVWLGTSSGGQVIYPKVKA